MANFRTASGEPLTGSMSGFSEYRIAQQAREANEPLQPSPIVTPQDILEQLENLQRKLKMEEYKQAIALLRMHVGDKDNPHQTDLDQFKMQIVDVLYNGYREAGGTGSKDHFIQCLFSALRVANQEEMMTSNDPKLLISVLGARRFMENHENDINAHEALIRHVFPGEEIYDSPVWAAYGEYGMSRLYCKVLEVNDGFHKAPYSYVGHDFKLHYCKELNELPRDWSTGRPCFPCFSRRTNTIEESTNFDTLGKENVQLLPESLDAPDGKIAATAIGTYTDFSACDHSLVMRNVFIQGGCNKVFSVFAKAESCRYLQISFTDMMGCQLEVRAMFNLYSQQCFIMNHLNRYSAQIVPMNNGWCRCILQMSHPLGQESTLKMTFYKYKENQEDTKFRGSGEICGYLWGMQMEDGVNASPYIPTTGEPVTRDPISLQIPLQLADVVSPDRSISVVYSNDGPLFINQDRPVLTVKNSDGYKTFLVRMLKNSSIELLHHALLTNDDITIEAAIHQDVFEPQAGSFIRLAHGYTQGKVVSRLNEIARSAELSREKSTGSILYLGNDGENFLEGYIDHALFYAIAINEAQAAFLVGGEL